MTKLTNYIRSLKDTIQERIELYNKCAGYYDEALDLVVSRDQTIAQIKTDLANAQADLSAKKLEVHKLSRSNQEMQVQIAELKSYLAEAHQQTDANAAEIDRLELKESSLKETLKRVNTSLDYWQQEAEDWRWVVRRRDQEIEELENEIIDLKAAMVQAEKNGLLAAAATAAGKTYTLNLYMNEHLFGTFPIHASGGNSQAFVIANQIMLSVPYSWTEARLILGDSIARKFPGPDQIWQEEW